MEVNIVQNIDVINVVVNDNNDNIDVNIINNIENTEVLISELGTQGVPGKSAYQIALDNGFIGTEQDWLESLKETLTYECGEQINSHIPVVLINNKLYKMDYETPLHQYSFVGFTKTSGNIGDMVNISETIITLDGWGLIPNTNYLIGSNGGLILQNTNPNSFTKIIGFSENSNTLLIYKHYNSIIKI